MSPDYSKEINRILGYTLTLSSIALFAFFLAWHREKRILRWIVILAASGAFFLIRYAIDLWELRQLLS